VLDLVALLAGQRLALLRIASCSSGAACSSSTGRAGAVVVAAAAAVAAGIAGR